MPWPGPSKSDSAADKVVFVSLSGRGDKDVATAAEWFDLQDKNSPEAAIGKEGEQL